MQIVGFPMWWLFCLRNISKVVNQLVKMDVAAALKATIDEELALKKENVIIISLFCKSMQKKKKKKKIFAFIRSKLREIFFLSDGLS